MSLAVLELIFSTTNTVFIEELHSRHFSTLEKRHLPSQIPENAAISGGTSDGGFSIFSVDGSGAFDTQLTTLNISKVKNNRCKNELYL